jgi:hypothetical protein
MSRHHIYGMCVELIQVLSLNITCDTTLWNQVTKQTPF